MVSLPYAYTTKETNTMQRCPRPQAAMLWRDVMPWQRSWQIVTGLGACTSYMHKNPHNEGASLDCLAATNPI